jgi:hypothetical protein
MLVSSTQRIKTHDRDYVGRTVYIVPRHLLEQTPCLLQAFVKPRAWRGLKQTNHRRHDSTLLDEIDLSLEDAGCIVIKTHDEAAVHLEASPLQSFHVLDKIAVQILLLAAFSQAILIRSLDAYKDSAKSCFYHHVHQLFIIGQVYGDFRAEQQTPFILPPFNERG